VTVVGATGSVGTHVTNGLLSKGAALQVTLLLRALPAGAPAAKAAARADFAKKGAKVVDIDVASASVAELAAALSGAHVLLSVVGAELLLDGQLKLVQAAKQAGVRRILPSEFGFNMAEVGRGSTVPVWDYKIDVQEAVKAAGLEYTFVETGLFGEYLLPFAGIDTAARVITAPGGFDTRITLSPLADVAAQLADLIVSGRGRNETVYFGTVNYSWADLHAALERVSGQPWGKAVRSAADFEADAAAGKGGWVPNVSLIIIRGKGTNYPPQDTYAAKHGVKLANFDDFLRNLLAAKK